VDLTLIREMLLLSVDERLAWLEESATFAWELRQTLAERRRRAGKGQT
jgi:hypothetical protein